MTQTFLDKSAAYEYARCLIDALKGNIFVDDLVSEKKTPDGYQCWRVDPFKITLITMDLAIQRKIFEHPNLMRGAAADLKPCPENAILSFENSDK